MRDIFASAADWLRDDLPFALATLVRLDKSKMAPPGTTLAFAPDGEILGNIGAGCYEGQIVEAAARTARDGVLRTIEVAGGGDELTGSTSCGSAMTVLVWRPPPEFATEARAIAAGARPVYLSVGKYACLVPPKDELVLVGATVLTRDVAFIGRRSDFRITVVDQRPAFATPRRLPEADEIIVQWPDEALPRLLRKRAAVVVLSHDPKVDVPALRAALRSEAWYVGLLGSRRAQASRRAALRAEGFGEESLARIHGPVGLDVGATTTGEIAVSIIAEILAMRTGRAGGPLAARQGAIH